MRKNATKREIRTGLAWLGLRQLTEYADVSVRSLRAWIHSPVDPLPAVSRGGKILVNRRAFDAWLLGHAVKPDSQVDKSDQLIKYALSKSAKPNRKTFVKRAQQSCIFDWVDGRKCGRLACVVHKHKRNSTVVISNSTALNEMLALGILTGQALNDARSGSKEG